jgi:predicted nucleotide-binding protein
VANTAQTVRPVVFVGSSSEGLELAKIVQVLLDSNNDVELWDQDVIRLSRGTLESLVDAIPRFDFAVLVLTADDLLISRGTEQQAARDNVIFELGLFMGGLGRDRTFILYDRANPPKLPSDLAGVTAATFQRHASGKRRRAMASTGLAPFNAVRLVARPPGSPLPARGRPEMHFGLSPVPH